MNQTTRTRIEAATVRFTRLGGQGVVVPGHPDHMIVTAAHVIKRRDIWRRDGFGDPHLEKVRAGRLRFEVDTFALEAISDIAVLGVPDTQALEEALDWQEALDSIEPVSICTEAFPPNEPFSVHILTHDKSWVDGLAEAQLVGGWALQVKAGAGIVGGSSGSPVVTNEGLFLGVVSSAGGIVGEEPREVTVTHLSQTVPAWFLREMLDPAGGARRRRKLTQLPKFR